MLVEWNVKEIATLAEALREAGGLMEDLADFMKSHGVTDAALELGTPAYHIELLCKNIVTRQPASIARGMEEALRVKRNPTIKSLQVGTRSDRQKTARTTEKHIPRLAAWTKELKLVRKRVFK